MNCLIIGDFGTSDKHQYKVADSMKKLIKEMEIENLILKEP